VIPRVLSVAGSDPSGGAGIQADLKTFSALGAYGMAVVTGLTAQSTTGVAAVQEVPAGFVARQLEVLFSDISVDAVKVGMLGSASVVSAVAAGLARARPPHVVLDPVMVAKSGDRLLTVDAVEVLVAELLPLADLVTPNLSEAAALLGEPVAASVAEMEDQARRLASLGARRVLLKGGHLGHGPAVDVLWEAQGSVRFEAPRVETSNDHGTGCTLSSALAVMRTRSDTWAGAVGWAKEYVTASLRAADQLRVGHGHGPLHHFHAAWAHPWQPADPGGPG
jgi:hydroxymethylpyrimidine/phosphomethylpyrimidine kinase